MFTVIETDQYRRAVEHLGLDDDEAFEIVRTIAADPLIGDLIPGTGGARKWRVPMKGKGKRGGGRVISYFAGDDMPVWLLDVFSKGEKINLTPRERAELKRELEGLSEDYRQSVRQRVSGIWEKRR